MLTMSVMLSPLRSQDPDPMATDASPMAINMTPTVGPGEGEEEEAMKDVDAEQQYGKPPPLHTVADWKIVLHLPEIETWLRMTSERVRELTCSVQQDADNKHVDVHLVQLKDICEDISDHVEQIHALLETEFSLKLLSYSVNVIVDIHAVQLLWHQLRVSVLVLRERILQGLQDANGNYTRQTDILQAFSEETKEGRLDSLTEVDDSGQLTIKCSQNYLSLDCGITAFELSDYSPSEDLLGGLGDVTSQAQTKPFDSWSYSEVEEDFPELIRSVGLLTVATNSIPSSCEAANEDSPQGSLPGEAEGDLEEHSALDAGEQPDSTSGMSSLDPLTEAPSVSAKQDPSSSPQLGAKKNQPVPCEITTPKRSIRDCFNYNEDSPTQPTLPKRGLFLKETRTSELKGGDGKRNMVDLRPELSRSTPSLVDPPDRSKLCLVLQSSYPGGPSVASQSYECLHKVGIGNIESIVRSHIKEISSSLGRLTDCHKEKCPLKRPRKTLAEMPLCGMSKGGTGSGKQTEPTRASAVRSMVPPGASKATLRPEPDSAADSASTSSVELSRRRNWSGQSPAGSKLSSSPPCSHGSGSEFSVGSDSIRSPVPPFSQNDSHTDSSPAPSHLTRTGEVVEPWYGSDEYLALPTHLKQTEVLALKLENLTKLLPPKPRGDTIQNIDDWELSEMNSDSEIYPTYHSKKKHTSLGRVSPSSSSDIASSLGESIESGPLSDILSDEDLCAPLSGMKKYGEAERPSSSENNESHSATKSALIQKLMQDIQHQDNYEAIWARIEGFVNKLDEFIQWLKEAMETTENWTPPKAETDSLRLYLETHLSFKLNVDSHCALKEAVEEEGYQLLELIASHKAEGLKDMLKMIARQWKELQRQIKRQHSWILRALDTIKAEILATDVSAQDGEGTGSPKAEVQLCYLEAERDAIEQMSLKLYSEQYSRGSKRKEEFADMSKVHSVGSNGLLDFDSEYQELWDWLIDMESLVMDSHDLMMSEEQQQHLYKRYSVEMSIRHLRKTELLSKVESLRKGGVSLPDDLLEKVDSINEKWELLGKTLREKIQDTMAGHSGSGPCDLLSPESGSLVRQLEARIKELKRWLRDTELLIFNSCLRHDKEEMSTEKQLQYFKSLSQEIKQRRRGVASILRLCQHLLDDRDTCNLNADHQPMQLIIVNLERRWEAIVMQAVQWQTRLQKKMGKESETLNAIDPGLMDLNGMSEDALEWDETDISNKLISLHEESNDLDQDQESVIPSAKLEEIHPQDPGYDEEEADGHGGSKYTSNITAPSSPHIYQVYSLHNVALHKDNHAPFLKSSPKLTDTVQPSDLTKSLSQDSSFPSTKSLPDLLGGSSLTKLCPCHSGDVSQNSGGESGIVSGGDNDMPANSEMCLLDIVGGSPSNPETEHLDPQMGDAVNVLKQKFRDAEECIPLPSISQSPISPVGCVNGKAGDLNSVTKHPTDCLGEELQGKHDVFTFYDYSYLQGSKLKLPMVMKQSQSEKAHVEDPLLCGFYFDKKSCKSKHQASELQPDEPAHERILASAPHEMGLSSYKSSDKEKTFTGIRNARQLPLLSRSSSIESLPPGGDLFGLGIFKNGSDSLQRSTSLESWLTSYKSNEDLFSCHSSGDLSVNNGSVGELSKRTLDLLNRLENIQSPSEQKIKRSVSDITLQSSSQKMSFTGQMSLDVASSINEDSAASLTELSSSDELSLCSEDIALHKNKIPESNASFRKRLNRSVADESDVNVSMIVNVSCTSACTDDEDDSDLLSSSTLTLTEEELCLKDEEDDSSIATDDEIYEESHLTSGLDYIKNELQTWIRPKFSLTRDKKQHNITDEMKGSKDVGRSEKINPSDTLNIEALLNGSIKCLSENNGNGKNSPRTRDIGTEGDNKRTTYDISKDPHMADMENGNVECSPERRKEKSNGIPEASEDRASSAKRSSESKHRNRKALTDSSDDPNAAGKAFAPPEDRHLPQTGLNLHYSEKQSAHCASIENSCPEALLETSPGNIQDSDGLKSSSDDARSGVRKSAGCCLLKQSETEESASLSNGTSCCRCQPDVRHQKDAEDCSVHHFVKEIIDMASTALKSKSQPEREVAAPTSLTQIKEKVLEHSHRPMHLRKGDFYSYLSLSSHDSDCGEVTSFPDEKSNTPLPPDAVDFSLDDKEDIECFFEACVEDDLVDEKACFSSALPNESAVLDTAAVPMQVTASSPVFSDVAFSHDETGMVALSGPSPRKGADQGKKVNDASQTSQGCAEGSEPAAPSGQARNDGSSGKQGESGMPGEKNATSAQSKIQALPLNAKQPKAKAMMYPSPQTLTCKEKLVSFHEDQHRNMHR